MNGLCGVPWESPMSLLNNHQPKLNNHHLGDCHFITVSFLRTFLQHIQSLKPLEIGYYYNCSFRAV